MSVSTLSECSCLTAYASGNDAVFPRVLGLCVRPGSTVADVTFGKGVFWRQIPHGSYDLLATDIATGIDCRKLPYEDGSIDAVVLNPPYIHSPGGSVFSDSFLFHRRQLKVSLEGEHAHRGGAESCEAELLGKTGSDKNASRAPHVVRPGRIRHVDRNHLRRQLRFV